LTDIGLDFNQEKMYQSGFEFRCFDEFPINYFNDVLLAVVVICEHSLHLPNVMWGHDSVIWNNLVFKSLKNGYATEIDTEEKSALLELLQVLDPSASNFVKLRAEFESITKLDEFFFKILAVLHAKYKDENTCIDALCGKKTSSPPRWENFNKFQIEQHLKQIEGFE
jgi:hypothetical protein